MRVVSILRALYLPALNLLYPANCHVCGAALSPFDDSPLCGRCLRSVRFVGDRACAGCGLPLPQSVPGDGLFLCGECRTTRHYFMMAVSALVYAGPVRQLIHLFKYSGRSSLARFFARALADAVGQRVEVTGEELVVPVPLHRSRKRERGYNQAAEIARHLARLLDLKTEQRVLERISQGPSQVGMTRGRRRENVKGRFRVRDRRLVGERPIFLVDDVYTTGATLDECARVLLRAGAARVVALTAARDVMG